MLRSARESLRWRIGGLNAGLQGAIFLAASHASLGSMTGGGSQAGLVILAAGREVLQGAGRAYVIDSSSTKINRMVRSSLAAEIAAANVALEHGVFLRAMWAEMTAEEFSLQEWRLVSSRWPLYLVLDARTGFEALRGDTQMTGIRVAIDVAALRESLEDPATKTGIRWLPGPQHVADSLTKRHGNAVLLGLSKSGQWSLRETEVRGERERVKQLRKQAADRRRSPSRRRTRPRPPRPGSPRRRRAAMMRAGHSSRRRNPRPRSASLPQDRPWGVCANLPP